KLVVQRALQASLRGDPEKMPRDVVKLLELLYELSVELDQPIGDDGCRAFLQQLSSGKTGKTAKNLLNLPPSEFATTARPILSLAIQQRGRAAESHTK